MEYNLDICIRPQMLDFVIMLSNQEILGTKTSTLFLTLERFYFVFPNLLFDQVHKTNMILLFYLLRNEFVNALG